jgi:hypothetical protein
MQAKTNKAPIWYLADVVSTAAMAERPHAEQFRPSASLCPEVVRRPLDGL